MPTDDDKPGAQIRLARAGDYDACTRLYGELGTRDPRLERTAWERDQMERTAVVEAGGSVIAYCLWIVFTRHGHVCELAVDRNWRGRGLGEGLLRGIAQRFRQAGLLSWTINVKVENTPAIRLYERLGFQGVSQWHEFVMPWALVARLPRGLALEVSLATRSEEPSLERHFSLEPGTLAKHRAKASENVVLVARGRTGAPAGVAVFAPVTGGLNPFRVRLVDAASSFLEGIAPYRMRVHSAFTLTVDGDEPLAAAVRATGVRSALSVLEMRGPLLDK
jgi:GNAT superfamily N-acetyltransferase